MNFLTPVGNVEN